MKSPGTLEASNSDIIGKKHLKDLLQLLPECEGSQWIENINSIFELLEERLTTLAKLMTETMTATGGHPTEMSRSVFKKISHDCSDMRYLIGVQKDKLGVICQKNSGFHKKFPFNARMEMRLLQNMFPEKASTVKSVPVPVPGADEKRQQTRRDPSPIVEPNNNCTNLVNDFKWILLYPSAIFTMSELCARTASSLSVERLKTILSHLKDLNFVKFCPLPSDYVIVKNFSRQIEKHFELFNMSRDDFVTVSTPESLESFRSAIDCLPLSAVNHLNKELTGMVAHILVATLILDEKHEFRHSELPLSLPNVIAYAMGSLFDTLIDQIRVAHDEDGKIDYVYTKKIRNTSESL